MINFTTSIKRFGNQAEKTGWTYIEIPADIAQQLKPGNKREFRVKGKLDDLPIKFMALMPMGGGKYIMALNKDIRAGIRKNLGAMVQVSLELDKTIYKLDDDLLTCLQDEPEAKKFMDTLTPSHRNYFSKWIQTAKTKETKARRIAMTISAMMRKLSFGEMLRENKKRKEEG